MKKSEMKKRTTSELLELYIGSASAYGAATEGDDYRTANKSYDIVANIYRELRRRGPDSQRAVLDLLRHQNDFVRSSAAYHTLEFAPELGCAALEEIAVKGGIVGFNAEMTLAEWRKGNLTFP